MLITTTSTIEGQKIEKYLGIVSSRVALGANLFSDIAANFRDVIGGQSKSVQNKLKIIEDQAIFELKKEANKLRADAVIGLSLGLSIKFTREILSV